MFSFQSIGPKSLTALCDAIEEENLAKLQHLLKEEKVDPNLLLEGWDDYFPLNMVCNFFLCVLCGPTRGPLIKAIKKGSLEMVQELLAAGADPNRTIGKVLKYTPSSVAVQLQNVAIFKALLDAGADVNLGGEPHGTYNLSFHLSQMS